MENLNNREKLWTFSLICAFLGNFCLFFAFYLLLPVLPFYLAEQFQADKATIGIILASYTLTALLIRPFSGFLTDYFARKPFLLLCYFIFIAFFAGYMIAGTLLMFAILRAAHGLAFGAVTVSNSTMAIDVMTPSRRNVGIGYFGVSTNLAMSVSPMFALWLHDHFANYSYIFISSLVTGLIGLLFVSLIKAPPKITSAGEPLSLDRFFLTKGLWGGINLLLFSFSFGIVSTFVAVYGATEIGVGSGSGLFFMLMAIGLISSRLLGTRLMNRGKLIALITIGIILMIVGYTIFVFLKNPACFYLSAAILGMAYGFICPAFQTMFINLARHNQRGTANSTYLTSWDIGIGLGVFIGGQIAEIADFSAAYLLGLGLVILGLFLFQLVTAGYYTRHKLR